MEYSLKKRNRSLYSHDTPPPSSINLRGVAAKSVLVPPCDNIGGVYIPLSGYLPILSLQLLAQPHRTLLVHLALASARALPPQRRVSPAPVNVSICICGWCISSASYGMRWRCTVILLDKRHAVR